MSEATKSKPGPKPVYGERRALLTRVDPELALEFEGYCAAAEGGPISVTEGLQRLIKQFCEKKRAQQKGPAPKRHPSAGPAPKTVTITALISHTDEEGPAPLAAVEPARPDPPPKPSDEGARLWAEARRTCEEYARDAWLLVEPLSLVSWEPERSRLTLEAPRPYLGVQADLCVETLGAITADLTGLEGVKVSLTVSPAYDVQARAEELAREQAEANAKAAAVQRANNLELLKKLYLERSAKSAQEAETILMADLELLEGAPSFFRKQIESWISSVNAGTAYQSGKEANYRGPGGRNR